MAIKKKYRTWKQGNGIVVDEVEFDSDTHAFRIYVDGYYIVTIYTGSPKDTEDIRASLDAGEDIRDWEDGDGFSVGAQIENEMGDIEEGE